MKFEDYQLADAPPWLRDAESVKWHVSLGQTKDDYVSRARAAVKARFPASAPSDGLDYVGSNFQIDRAFAPNDAAFVKQLETAWEQWEASGTADGMVKSLTAAGVPAFQIIESYQWSEGWPLGWFNFWVVVRAPFPWTCSPLAAGLWGAADGTWGDPGNWAEEIPLVDWQRMRRIIRKWKPPHARCASLVLLLSGELFGTWGGTWADHAAVTWATAAGTAVYLEV